MEEGVECMVEVVKEREVHRGVVVVARSEEDYEVECASVFAAVVQKVMEAKTEFCHSITPETYLIDPDELNQSPLPSVSKLHLYAMCEVERMLAKRKGAVSWMDTGFWIQTNSPTWAVLLSPQVRGFEGQAMRPRDLCMHNFQAHVDN